ncbi:MAG: sigma-54 interaction domain-containing protein [Planctomycetota bacterium]
MNFHGIIGDSPALRRAIGVLQKAAPTDAPVLLLGESGTGKELFARALHALSARRAGPFVAISCAALPETLLDSELFGHVRGAFTGAVADAVGKFEAAHGGTIFLDEVGEMSQALQAKLLRTLQEGEIQPVGSPRARRVDVRVVCATNRDLEGLVRAGRFRQDLFFRLNVVSLRLPPLRERREDLEPLARHFLEQDARELRRSLSGFSPAALARLRSYDWPGNVRELRNAVRYAALMATGPHIEERNLPDWLRGAAPGTLSGEPPRTARELARAKKLAREAVERAFLIEALRNARGNMSRAAAQTGVHRTRLAQLARRYGISPQDFRTPLPS